VINPYTDEVSESFLAGDHPVRSLVSTDNSTLYVSNFASNSVAVFNANTRKLITTVEVGSKPDALALTPAENMLLAANSGSGDVAMLLLDKRSDKKVEAPPPRLFLMIPTGARPSEIAVKTASKATLQ
jgi:YVTN family beta-propeller protein